MSMLNTQSSWNVGRSTAQCSACGTQLAPSAVCWAALIDRPPEQLSPEERAAVEAAEKESKKKGKAEEKTPPSPFLRVDFCETCWTAGKRPTAGALFSFWKTQVPEPQQKKKLLVDDAVLVDVFQRMEGRTEPQEIRFRFVLALILMRKRLLKYDGMEPAPSAAPAPAATPDQNSELRTQDSELRCPEHWRMIPRGSDKPVIVINPHLTADQITEVSQQLSAILAEEI